MNKNLAVVFDFDDTLAHDSTTDFLAELGVDLAAFWGVENQKLIEAGWDPVPAYLYQMVQFSQKGGSKNLITQQKLREFAPRVRFYPGVPELFAHLRTFLAGLDSTFRLEFYVISSGLGDLIRATPIAGEFADIFASDFHYGPDGGILFPKKVVSFTDKTRYLFQISKGQVGPEFANKPFEVNRKVRELALPLSQMIFIGDGMTDVPCFSLLAKSGGMPFAVYDREKVNKRSRAWGFVEDGRVKNLHSANYRKESDLVGSIEMSLQSLVQKIKFGYQG
ncbi:MAG: haloacid dehalogenase-like hydrolase [Spirochaetales bacterium]|nr:haloacid dehalogenase-like hydrolase [Spirochaetales bacterium]